MLRPPRRQGRGGEDQKGRCCPRSARRAREGVEARRPAPQPGAGRRGASAPGGGPAAPPEGGAAPPGGARRDPAAAARESPRAVTRARGGAMNDPQAPVPELDHGDHGGLLPAPVLTVGGALGRRRSPRTSSTPRSASSARSRGGRALLHARRGLRRRVQLIVYVGASWC